jgi:CRISPR-associated endonuclease/helicase Cas3
MISRLSYPEFFQKVAGYPPYPCQIAYAEADASFITLRLPTGIGKTLTVLVAWLYRQYLGQAPTRLVIMEPMRVLVSQVVAEAKRVVRASEQRVRVHLLMGGAIDNTWIAEPDQPCVIVGTQDQILSRQLNRGYACSRWSWPQHFALLNNDCEFFIDECQLMGVGYSTSVELSHWRTMLKVFGNCRVIWSSATLDSSPLRSRGIQATEVDLNPSDYTHPVLSQKISRAKWLHRLDLQMGSGYAQALANQILDRHCPDTLTLVIVNQVSRAIAVFEALQTRGVRVKLLHSRFRRGDRERLVEGIQEFRGIIVATQVVEAGVDLDARILFTELATWSSVVQRFGRCGRNATYPEADIYWISTDSWPDATLLPYSRSDCQWSQQTLVKLQDASIQKLLAVAPPAQNIAGVTITEEELSELFDNHPSDDGRDIDVSRFIRVGTRPNIEVAWADAIPASDWFPAEEEFCSVPLDQFKRFRTDVYVWDEFKEEWILKNLNQLTYAVQRAVLLMEWGGYSNLLGFTGKSSDKPSALLVRTGENVKSEWDRPAYLEASQSQHGAGQAYEMARIRAQLSHLGLPNWLDEVAALSDWGKSHPVWQKSATGHENPPLLLAKSKHLARHARAGFRHEFASSLAIFQLGKPFHYAYLAAAHHGKCRVQFCPWGWDEPGCMKGIKAGDVLPATDLGICKQGDLTLNLPSRNTWKQKVDHLINQIGVFRLAFLEALIRAADIADSKKYELREPGGVGEE